MVSRVGRLVMVFLGICLLQSMFLNAAAFGASDLEIVVSKDKMLDHEVHNNSWAAYPNGMPVLNGLNYVGYFKEEPEEYVSYKAIQFDLNTVDTAKTIQSAGLMIYIHDCLAEPVAPFLNVWGIDNDNWDENVTVAPHPNDLIHGQLLVSEHSALATGQWVTFDVTSFIRTQAAGNKLASFVLGGRTTNPIGGGNTQSAVHIPDHGAYFDSTKHCRLAITYAPVGATITADQALTEANLNGRQITVTLSGTTFAATLTAGNFTLNNAPPGVGIASVSRVNDTTATLNLSYDGTDFDSNRNLGLTIAASALASGASLTAGNTLTITAVDDPESITLSQATDIWEGAEDGKVVIVTLSGGTFSQVLTPANWTVSNLPAGVVKGAVTRVNATTVHITLSGNSTAAYAGNINNVSVTLTNAEYNDSTGGGPLTADSGVLLRVGPEAYTITLAPAANGSAAGGGTFEAGQSVTLSAVPDEGYNFAGWYEDGIKVSALPNYTFTVTVDRTLTPIFAAMPGGQLQVITATGGSVTLNDGASPLPADYTQQHPWGTSLRLTATPDAGYTFGYWANVANNGIISTNPVYECLMGAGVSVKAVFNKISTPEDTHFTVVFRDKSGRILQSTSVARGTAATPPVTPAMVGYSFQGWDRDFSNVTEPLTINAVYQRLPATYTVTVVNGTLSTGGTSGAYQFDTRVTVVADAQPPGQKFSHWEQDGKKVSLDATFGFFVLMANTTLTAVFVSEETVLVSVPFITLSGEILVDTANGTMMFIATRVVPHGYTLVESGVLLLKDPPPGELTLNTAGVIRGKIKNNSTDQFYVRKINILAGETWYGRAYLIYQDAAGNVVTVYSENTEHRTL